MKVDFPELENLHYTICSWDYYNDLVEENLILKHIEEDKIFDELKINSNISTNNNNNQNKLVQVPIKFTNSEEYVKIFGGLFIYEVKGQITRSKTTEKEDTETFLLNFVKYDKTKKFSSFELIRVNSTTNSNISYTSGDLILIHKFKLTDENGDTVPYIKEHCLGIIEKYLSNENLLCCKVVFTQGDERSFSLAKYLTKNSEWYVTRICNLATVTREYQALHSIDYLRLTDQLIHPGSFTQNSEYNHMIINNKQSDDNFFIPKKLENKLRIYFNQSQYDALKSSIKKRGVTLVQGPPGTGKSTTILGILSVILNSLLKKESPDRKNSIITQVNQEYMDIEVNDKIKNGHVNKDINSVLNHPWLYTNPNDERGNKILKNKFMDFDKIDFTMDDIFNFHEYPSSKTTDNYKFLSKPVDEDITPPEKILVCAPSNVAIDEIVRKMMNVGLMDADGNNFMPKFVRVGPNYHPSLREYSLDYQINQRLGQGENSSTGNNVSSTMSLNSSNYDKIKHEILSTVKIVCATLSMAGSNTLAMLGQKFDTVVIDESAQAVEISTLIPLKYGCERLILVGDPKQLAATVFSQTALKNNYDQSLFKRFQLAGHEVIILKTQYRMHRLISRFISDTFYEGLLEDDQDIDNSTCFEKCLLSPAFQPFTYYDVEYEECFNGASYSNDGQILVIKELIKLLKKIYTIQEIIDKVAIISPYSSQVYKLKEMVRNIEGFGANKENVIEVNTVDGFQGKEKQIIIFSTVRSKGSKSIGFLSDERRMNVGLSRAKTCLIVIGDTKKLMKDDNWFKLVKYSFGKGTFYKVPATSDNKIIDFFSNVEENCKKYIVKDEESFGKLLFT